MFKNGKMSTDMEVHRVAEKPSGGPLASAMGG
jgi:hypothetical protein